MRAMDAMTTDVIKVDPDTTVQSLVTLLAERGSSGALWSMPTAAWRSASAFAAHGACLLVA